MKKLYDGRKTMFIIFFILSYFFTPNSILAEVPIKERNILAKKGKEINLTQILITDNSWNKLPTYKDKQFWQNIFLRMRNFLVLN